MPFSGPYLILKDSGNDNFLLKRLEDGKTTTAHANRFKLVDKLNPNSIKIPCRQPRPPQSRQNTSDPNTVQPPTPTDNPLQVQVPDDDNIDEIVDQFQHPRQKSTDSSPDRHTDRQTPRVKVSIPPTDTPSIDNLRKPRQSRSKTRKYDSLIFDSLKNHPPNPKTTLTDSNSRKESVKYQDSDSNRVADSESSIAPQNTIRCSPKQTSNSNYHEATPFPTNTVNIPSNHSDKLSRLNTQHTVHHASPTTDMRNPEACDPEKAKDSDAKNSAKDMTSSGRKSALRPASPHPLALRVKAVPQSSSVPLQPSDHQQEKQVTFSSQPPEEFIYSPLPSP